MATNIPGKHLDVLRIPNVTSVAEVAVVLHEVKTLRNLRMETDSTTLRCFWSRTPGGTWSMDNYGEFRADAGRLELQDVELQPLDAGGTFFYVRAVTDPVEVEVVYTY